ncbi:glycosyltransferase family 2 protein [Thermotoga profunda]|uniref:glycosyltransferase family 2 protein n=1 Tax=Thermotoga profunda TaxID=1508420 RepID=UPI0005976276|nr:glycosyltransferase family 2 protein [Thermotoga profunda]
MFGISVVIPAHNSEKYLGKCIDSVTRNTFQDSEIVVIENGSSDRTLHVAKECLSKMLPAERYKIISIPEGNVSKARNEGIKASNGKYLFFLDSDDYISPETLGSLYKAAEENRADITYCPFDRILQSDTECRKLSYEKLYKSHKAIISGVEFLKDFLKGRKWLCTGNNIIRRDLINNGKIWFPEEFHGGEDQYFYMEILLHAKKVVFSPSGRMFYVQRTSGSLAASDKVLDSLKAYELFTQEVENDKYFLDRRSKDEILNLIRRFKLPYLYVRAFYRLSKIMTYDEMATVMRAKRGTFKKMPLPLPVSSKLWFPTFVGYVMLRYFPKLFYIMSNRL